MGYIQLTCSCTKLQGYSCFLCSVLFRSGRVPLYCC